MLHPDISDAFLLGDCKDQPRPGLHLADQIANTSAAQCVIA